MSKLSFWVGVEKVHSLQLQFNFSSLKGKVVLVENTASLWGTTTRDFKQMNELCEKYGEKLVSKYPYDQLELASESSHI